MSKNWRDGYLMNIVEAAIAAAVVIIGCVIAAR
jgi:hypothetical protein